MQGKLASPSIAVKEDVIDALRTCFDTYRLCDLAPFYPSLVAHMKNEVVKLSSFADRASSPTLTKCIFMCCEILGRISKTCGVRSQAEALEIFGPVLEGFLAALSADTSITSAYATMVFHVLTGSWSCCLFLSSYLFSMLSMSLSDADGLANAYILFAALVTGMLDALTAFPAEGQVETMRGCIERSTPPVAEAVQQCMARWGAAGPSAGSDDFTVVCGCEFVVAVLRLSLRLEPWLAPDVVRAGIDSLVWAALFRSTDVAGKVCKLLRDYAEDDRDGVRGALVRLLSMEEAPLDAGLVVVGEIASTSVSALLLAYDEGFLSSSCAWMTSLTPEDKARTFHKALECFEGTLRHDEAEHMSAVLTRSDVDPAFFPCACLVARSLSSDTCSRFIADDVAVFELGMAALLASRSDLQGAAAVWSAKVEGLVMLTTSLAAPWRRVGMEGVTGAVLNRLVHGDCSTAVSLTPSAALLVAVAALWGDLLAAAAGDATAQHLTLVSSFAAAHLQGEAAAEGCGGDTVVEAFTYLPFGAQHSETRPSLLHLLLAAGKSHALHTSAAFCTAVQCLVESETAAQVHSCLAELLEVLNGLTESHGARRSALARSLLFSINAKCDGDAALARSVLFCSASVGVLVDGTVDAALSTRQRSLQLLTSLARGAIAMSADCTAEEKATLATVRALVLVAVKHSLGDHKRKVRQAAGACSHDWFKVR